MIIKKNQLKTEIRENMRQGEKSVSITHLANQDQLCQKGRLFARITLEPGSSIGYHTHEGDCEIFNILSGSAEYSDNGTLTQVHAGDVLICPKGEGHSIKNNSDCNVELTALIIYA